MIVLANLTLLLSLPLAALFCGFIITRAPSKFRLFLPAFISIFFILAYCYEPTYENDLARYFVMIDNCRHLPLRDAFSWGNDGLALKNFIFWIVAQLGDKHLMPAISTSTLYGVSAYIACDTCQNKKVLWRVLLVQLMLLPFLEVVSNVRNVMVFALMILAVYRDLCQKKRDIATLLLYLLPIFIHFAGIVIIGLRLALFIVKKHPVIAAILCVGIPSAAIYAYNTFYSLIRLVPGNIGLILSRALHKAYASSVNTSDYAVSMRESGYFNVCRFVLCIAMIGLLILCWDYVKRRGQESEFVTFTVLIVAITIVWIVLKTVKYWVFGVAATIVMPMVVSYYFSNYRNLSLRLRLCVMGIASAAFLRFVLELYFMSSRIYWGDFIINSMTYNVYYIFLKVLAAII